MKAVIFDMDGVLIDSEVAHQKAEIQALADHGLQVTVEDLKPYAGANRRAFRIGITKQFGVDLDWDSIYEEKDRLLFRYMEDVEALPGVLPLLKAIRQTDCKLAVATSSPKPLLDFVVNKFELAPLFDTLVCNDDITQSKPDPQIFLIAAERLHVKPVECIVIEDSLNGIKAAKAAGMFTIAVPTTFRHEELGDADRIIDSFEGLSVESLLNAWNEEAISERAGR